MNRAWRVAWPSGTGFTFEDYTSERHAHRREEEVRATGGVPGQNVITYPIWVRQ